MNAKDLNWALIDVEHDEQLAVDPRTSEWSLAGAPLPAGVSVRLRTLRGGLRDGVRVLTVDVGSLKATILPDRGMGLHRVHAGELTLGWQSPVKGPVHPAFVPVGESSGIGWLWGFDEFLSVAAWKATARRSSTTTDG